MSFSGLDSTQCMSLILDIFNFEFGIDKCPITSQPSQPRLRLKPKQGSLHLLVVAFSFLFAHLVCNPRMIVPTNISTLAKFVPYSVRCHKVTIDPSLHTLGPSSQSDAHGFICLDLNFTFERGRQAFDR